MYIFGISKSFGPILTELGMHKPYNKAKVLNSFTNWRLNRVGEAKNSGVFFYQKIVKLVKLEQIPYTMYENYSNRPRLKLYNEL